MKDLSTGQLADSSLWWHFTVGTVTSAVSKIAPATGPATLGRSVTLQWGSTLNNPNYWVCWDASNNNTCNYTWLAHGTSPTWTLNGLASGRYYWQVKGDAGGGAIEADGGTWWTFTVAPAPYYISVVPWGLTQTWIRWADEAEDQTDFHVERSANGGPWTQILEWATYQYLDPNPPCGPVAYRVRAHWQGLGLYSAYSSVVSIRACAPVTPGTLSVREWWGATRLDWGQSWQESDLHVERQVDWGEWEEIVQLGAGTQNYVDSAQVCGVVAYRVRAHRHDSGQYSDYTNVASRTRTCGEPTAAMSPPGGENGTAAQAGGISTRARWASRLSPSTWLGLSTWFGLLSLLILAGLLGLAWGSGVRLARACRPRRVLRPATRLASVGLLMSVALLLPASVLAQSGQVVEFYHLDALGSVRAVSNQEGQIISRHEFLPFGEEWTPGTPQRENKLFTAKERDPETSFDYFGARYYDSQVGRFTTIDPVYTWKDNLTDPQRWNRYAYVRNNPLKYVDPDGRKPEDRVRAALSWAQKIRYVPGGGWENKEPKDGLDCAGLVRQAFKADPDNFLDVRGPAGDERKMFRSSAEAEFSDRIADARPGDAIFWKNSAGDIQHTGIVTEIDEKGRVWVVDAAGVDKGVKHRPIAFNGDLGDKLKFAGIGRSRER